MNEPGCRPRTRRHRTGVSLAVVAVTVMAGVCLSRAHTVHGKESYKRSGTWSETMLQYRQLIRAVETIFGSQYGTPLAMAFWDRALRDHPYEMDWLLQDKANDLGRWVKQGGEAKVERSMIERVLGELGHAGEQFREELRQLMNAGANTQDRRWLDLYARACERRRQIRLAPLIAAYPRIIFTKNHTIRPSFFAYTEGQSDAQAERHFTPGSALCLLEWDGSYADVTTLIDDPHGRIRDPEVSYDGNRILFAWKKSDRKDDYHLYEMEFASRRIRQLTSGLGFADYEGAYLPSGDIVFSSTRCVQTVDCWWTEVSNLYICNPDGEYLRRVGYDQVHTIAPSVLDDGTVIYTRWDYNDRGQVYPQGLFSMNPDGTAQTEFYGNNSWFPTTLSHARGIPGTGKVVATAHGHHTWQAGELVVLDVSRGRQEASGVRLIAPVRETKMVRVDRYGQEGDLFQYPYPVGEREFLVGYSPLGGRSTKFAIYFMTEDARRELLVRDSFISCNHPVPLAPRKKPRVRPSVVDYRQSTGTFFMLDVYAGPGLAGVPRGTVKKLRVVALDFRAAGVRSNRNRGEAGGALISTPISVGNGCWDVKEVLGEATVYKDGSAYFVVPARTPLYFQAVDGNGHVAQTMRSWATLMPGEKASCIGCHEENDTVPPAAASTTIAMRKGPQPLTPFHGPRRGFSFPREIQPILDRNCIGCHYDRGKHSRGGLSLSKEESGRHRAFSLLSAVNVDRGAGRKWSDAYLALTGASRRDRAVGDPDRGLVNWISAQSRPTMLPPYHRGAATSELLEILEMGHYDTKLSRAEFDRIACWIDLGVPYCGDYTEANAWTDREKAKYASFQRKRARMKKIEEENIKALIEARQTSRSATHARRRSRLLPFPR